MDHITTGLDLVTVNNNKAMSIVDVINPISLLYYYFFGKGIWLNPQINITF